MNFQRDSFENLKSFLFPTQAGTWKTERVITSQQDVAINVEVNSNTLCYMQGEDRI